MPLIRVKIIIDDTAEIEGIYDSGSNVSLINKKILKIKNNFNFENNSKSSVLRTINGINKPFGYTFVKIKMLGIERKVRVFIVDNEYFKYDFLIGLDMIKDFKLIQDENLCITRKKENKENIAEFNVDNNKFFEVNFNEGINTSEFIINTDELDMEQQNVIQKLVKKYEHTFAKDKFDIGTVSEYEARIDLQVDKYCCKRPYRCTMDDKKEIEQQISMLLKNGLVEESYSPFAAPVTLAFKRGEDRKNRLCIDFRELNKIVVPQSHPFPLIEDLMAKTRDCKFFSTLDINSAFWSIPLRVEDRNKTGFVTQEGHYQWTCLPFGLKTAPAIFQRVLSSVLRKYDLSNFAVNYIDDILIFSKTFEDHVLHLEKLFRAIKIAGFRIKFSKCTFGASSVKYLGHIIKNNVVTPLTDNLISIKEFPVPKTRKNVRQFLGKINFYGKYIQNLTMILEPIHQLLRKNTVFYWSQNCQKSFEYVKNLLCKKPILTIFDPKLPIFIYTDASLLGVGAVLKQPQPDGGLKPVAYFSKKLNESQKRKKAIYLECLAIKECVKYWQHWLIGTFFTVISDHKPLENLNIKARTDEELGDLTYYLSQYNFVIKYSPGKNNAEADCLSRNPVLEPGDTQRDILKIVNFVTIDDIKKDQENNPLIRNSNVKLNLINDVYYKKNKDQNKVYLSEDFSKVIIKKTHLDYCHLGPQQMKSKIKSFYAAKNLDQNINAYCKNCIVCLKNKSRLDPKLGLLSQLGPATEPMQYVSIDTIGGFGGRRSTKKYLHILIDHFTRFVYGLCSSTQSASDFIKLVQMVNVNYKIKNLLTDQYPGINSSEFKNFLSHAGINVIFTAVNTAFSNGINERVNQTIVNKIRCCINDNEEKKENKQSWANVAKLCINKYNQTEHSVTRFAPEYLLTGKFCNIIPNSLNNKENNLSSLERDRKLAYERSMKSHSYNKTVYDKNRKMYIFNEGESVLVEHGNRLNRSKLDELRIGPFKIEKKISNIMYKINTGYRKDESNIFHISKLVPLPSTSLDLGGEM